MTSSTCSAIEITAITDDGEVTFEHGAPRRFDLIVGADGLHSGVRRIVFGDDVPERFLGGYLAVVSVPKSLAREGEMDGYFEPDRVAMVYTADHLEDARAVFIFRPRQPLDYDHRDVATPARASCAPHSPACPHRSTDGSRRWSTRRRSTSTPSPSSS